MAGFGIASNTAWSFFMDRDNGIFEEMLTYPISRAEYLVGKVLFNVGIGLAQALVTVLLRCAVLGVALRLDRLPLLAAAVVVGTAGWFFFYAIFALAIRRNDAFNTVTSIFYFVFLFASSMFIRSLLPAASRGRACEPDHVACGRPAIRHDRTWGSTTDRSRGGRLRGVHAGFVYWRAGRAAARGVAAFVYSRRHSASMKSSAGDIGPYGRPWAMAAPMERDGARRAEFQEDFQGNQHDTQVIDLSQQRNDVGHEIGGRKDVERRQ
jgi:hypothetical protein